jgi:hypothetical protein
VRVALALAALAAAVLLLRPAPAARVVLLEPGTVEIAAPIEITGSRVEVRG